jgi:hypothetical protein
MLEHTLDLQSPALRRSVYVLLAQLGLGLLALPLADTVTFLAYVIGEVQP